MASAGQLEGGQGQRRSAIIIGGGVGGLAVAGRLAKEGLAVTLLEKNAEVGRRSAHECSLGTAIGQPGKHSAPSSALPAAHRKCCRHSRRAGRRPPAVGDLSWGLPTRHRALAAALPGQVRRMGMASSLRTCTHGCSTLRLLPCESARLPAPAAANRRRPLSSSSPSDHPTKPEQVSRGVRGAGDQPGGGGRRAGPSGALCVPSVLWRRRRRLARLAQ